MNADVLLVEDNPTDAELTIRALKKQNTSSRIVHLANGAEAVAFLFGEQQRCKTDVHADVDHTDGAIAFEIVRILEE